MRKFSLYRLRGLCAGAFALALLLLPRRFGMDGFRLSAAAILLAGAGALRVWARTAIGEHTRGGELDAPALAVSGPYAKMRHPLYLANLFAGWGFVVLACLSVQNALILALLWCAFCRRLGVLEDRWLEAKFGDEWREWAARTPFWGVAPRKVAPPAPEKRMDENPETSSSAPPRRSAWKAFRADFWTWCWQILLAALFVSREFLP